MGAARLPWVPGLSAILLFAVLAEALHRTRGHFKTNRVIFVTLALGAFAAATWSRSPGGGPGRPRLRQLATLFVLGAALLVLDPRLLHVEVDSAREALAFLNVCALGAAAVSLTMAFRRPGAARVQAVLLLAVVALALSRGLTLVASPAPHIDVFTTTDRAVDYLLSGTNPYGADYPDIYEGRYDYAPGLVYWPGTVVFAALGKLAFGDLRAAWLIGDLACAAGLGWLAVRGGGRARPADVDAAGSEPPEPAPMTLGLLAAATWLAFPVGLFVLEQAWVDPLVLAALLFAAIALDAERFVLAGALLGLAAAIKQPAALAGLLAFGVVLFVRPKASLRVAGAAAIVFAALVAPFAAGDPQGLWRMTITVPLSQAMRADSLSLVALMSREWGVALPGAVSAVAYLALLVALVARGARAGRADGAPAPAHRFLPALALLYGVVFLLGKQAFCNYWALTAGLVLAARLAAPPRSDTEPLYG